MRVLIIHPALAPYRVDFFNVIHDIADAKIIFLRKNLLSQAFDQSALLQRLRIRYVYLTKGLNLKTQMLRFGMAKEVGTYRPDLVIGSEFSISTLLMIFVKPITSKKFSLASIVDDNIHNIQQERRIRSLARKLVLSGLDGMIVTNEEVKRWYIDVCHFNKPILVMPIIADDERFALGLYDATDTANTLIERHNLVGKKVLLYVGRLSPEKNLMQLLKVFRSLSPINPDARLVIVGDGPLRSEIDATINDYHLCDRVLMTGRLEGNELNAWYRLARVFILLSLAEPFGAVVNEALLSGLPVICSCYAGAKSLITHDQNGAIVDPDDLNGVMRETQSWLNKTTPVPTSLSHQLQPSLMLNGFDSYINEIENFLHQFTREHNIL